MAAVPAGLVTWWVFGRLAALGAAPRELVEAVTALLAAVVLFWVSFWLISKAESRRWMAYLKTNIAAGLERRNLLVLSIMAFLAAYREAAETVLFTQALLLESPHARSQVWAGALCGLLVVALVAAVMRRAVMSLPIGPFFAVSGVLLCLLSVSFTGSGLYTLIGSGYLPPRPVRFPDLPLLGVRPDVTILAVQSAILLTIAAAGLVTWRRAARS
jgi:high-affinity iron transporter